MRISDWSSDVCSSDLLVDLEVHAVDGAEQAVGGLEVDREVANLEQAHERFIFGSSASRSPSPKRLMASTVIRMARPGKVTTHHARVMNSRASASMAPHSGVGGCAPWPRKPSAAASRIAVDKHRGAWKIGRESCRERGCQSEKITVGAGS